MEHDPGKYQGQEEVLEGTGDPGSGFATQPSAAGHRVKKKISRSKRLVPGRFSQYAFCKKQNRFVPIRQGHEGLNRSNPVTTCTTPTKDKWSESIAKCSMPAKERKNKFKKVVDSPGKDKPAQAESHHLYFHVATNPSQAHPESSTSSSQRGYERVKLRLLLSNTVSENKRRRLSPPGSRITSPQKREEFFKFFPYARPSIGIPSSDSAAQDQPNKSGSPSSTQADTRGPEQS